MKLKLYRAATMAEAMKRLRADLGADALILSSRRVADGIEVTAGLEDREPDLVALPGGGENPVLNFHSVPAHLIRELERGPLLANLAAQFRFEPLSLQSGCRPVLLAGPPGAGKTLTTARLATRLVMKGILPLVITTDFQQAGGAAPLAAFTRLLGVRLVTIDSPDSLKEAMQQRVDGAPVLIDLAGGNPFQSSERKLLAAFANAAGGTVVAVLPAGMDPRESADLAGEYRNAGARQLIATRLDIARRIGGVLSAAGAGLSLAEAGIGPGATDGLVPFTPELLLQRLMLIPPGQCLEPLDG